MFAKTVEDMRLIGGTMKWDNPVTLGVTVGIIYAIYEAVHCMALASDCSVNGSTPRDLAVLMLWNLTILFWVPTITFGLKLIKNFLLSGRNLSLSPEQISIGEGIIQLIGGFGGSMVVYMGLQSLRVRSACMRKRECEGVDGFLLMQNIAESICGNEELGECFYWVINAYWLIPFGISYLTNHILEGIWYKSSCSESSCSETIPPVDGRAQLHQKKSRNPKSPFFVAGWKCQNNSCPNHNDANLDRFRKGIIGQDFQCNNSECEFVDRFSNGIPINLNASPLLGGLSLGSNIQPYFEEMAEANVRRVARDLRRLVCDQCQDRIERAVN